MDAIGFDNNDLKWFMGRVVAVNDPESRGRAQIRIYGTHTGNKTLIDDADLPWADCMVPTTEGGVSGIGRMPQLKPSALVFGFFLDGSMSQVPLIIGSLVHDEMPSLAQTIAAGSRGQGRDIAPSNLGADGVRISPTAQATYRANPNRDGARLAAMQFFVENGIPPIGAAGICGNIEGESGWNPDLVHQPSSAGDTERSYGLTQWNPAAGRLQLLQGWAAQQNKDYREFNTQLEYILYELGIPAGTQTRFNEHGLYFNAGQLIKNASRFEGGVGDENSTWVFISRYERPSDPRGKLRQREIYARTAYEQFTTASSVATPTPPSAS